MEEGGKALTERELIEDIISINIPDVWKKDFFFQRLDKADSINDIQDPLQTIKCQTQRPRKREKVNQVSIVYSGS